MIEEWTDEHPPCRFRRWDTDFDDDGPFRRGPFCSCGERNDPYGGGQSACEYMVGNKPCPFRSEDPNSDPVPACRWREWDTEGESPVAFCHCEESEHNGGPCVLPVAECDHRDTSPRKCRVCGCTDDNCAGCIERTGKPCYWEEPDLCSACALPVDEDDELSICQKHTQRIERLERRIERVAVLLAEHLEEHERKSSPVKPSPTTVDLLDGGRLGCDCPACTTGDLLEKGGR